MKLSLILCTKNGIKEYHDVPAVTLENFAGNFGGILNLWIGLSFVTLIELCELVINIIAKFIISKNIKVKSAKDINN